MATHKTYATYDNDLKKIEQAMAELKARAKHLRSRTSLRTRLLRYLTEAGYTRADLMWAVQHMPLIRISKKHREARLAEVRQKHAPKVNKRQKRSPVKARPEHQATASQLKEARTAKGWNMQETARQVGVHNSMISSWEAAKWGITPENKKKLEDVLDFKFRE